MRETAVIKELQAIALAETLYASQFGKYAANAFRPADDHIC
ncbi:MAG TPA: hypothetical protein VKG25_05925 [Bryobacteraceae bacterium]|nr:hypothetical protein [Bryobacteraceae bacterium]